jgi:hypothetical protein
MGGVTPARRPGLRVTRVSHSRHHSHISSCPKKYKKSACWTVSHKLKICRNRSVGLLGMALPAGQEEHGENGRKSGIPMENAKTPARLLRKVVHVAKRGKSKSLAKKAAKPRERPVMTIGPESSDA